MAVKVLTNSLPERTLSGELGIYEHLSNLKTSHTGSAYIRGLYDTFDLLGQDGIHRCLVQPPMHMSLHELRMRSTSQRLDEFLFKQTLLCILRALDFLHREANVVHTGMSSITADRREYFLEMTYGVIDIKATNIMLSIDDKSILEDFEKAEQQSPSPKKVVDENRTIYTSRRLRLPNDNLWGQPVLCDLGQARIGHAHRGLIQPDIYRAPEVLFDMGWGHSADIWNLGVMVSRYNTNEVWLLTPRRRGIFLKGDIYSVRLMKTRNTRRPTT